MRVLMLSDFYPPTVGGLERHVQMLAHELARRGHDVAVATLQQGREDATGAGAAPCEEEDGPGSRVRLYRLAGWSRALAPFYEDRARPFHPTAPDPGVVAALRRVVAVERPHIVHAHGWMLYSFLPLKRWSGARLVMTLHDYGLVCAKKTLLREGRPCAGPDYPTCLGCAAAHYGAVKGAALTSGLRLSRTLHGRVDRYLAVGSTVRAASMAATAGRPVDVIPSFVPDGILATDGAREAGSGAGRPGGHGGHGGHEDSAAKADGGASVSAKIHAEGLPARDGYILFVGALGTHKGLRVLLEAYEGLPERTRPPLLLIGTRQADTPARFPEGVSVVYDAPHATVLAAYDGAAVGVVPSLWAEPFGQVAVEALARGLPVVASADGALAELVDDGETGLLVPPGDAAALREALRTLLADPARRARMGQAGRRRARRFALSSVAARVEAVYADLLAADAP